MFNVGPMEIMLILVLALLVFGPKRLPEIGRTVGKGLREFRKASQDIRDEFEGVVRDDDEAASSAPAGKAQTEAAAEAPASAKDVAAAEPGQIGADLNPNGAGGAPLTQTAAEPPSGQAESTPDEGGSTS